MTVIYHQSAFSLGSVFFSMFMQPVKSLAFVFHLWSPLLAIFLNDFSVLRGSVPCTDTFISSFPSTSSSVYLINTFPDLPTTSCLYNVTHFTSFYSSTIASCPFKTPNDFVFPKAIPSLLYSFFLFSYSYRLSAFSLLNSNPLTVHYFAYFYLSCFGINAFVKSSSLPVEHQDV